MNDFFQDKGLLLAVAWLTREMHVCWPAICRAWPWIVQHGGIRGVIYLTFNGPHIYVQQPTPENPAQPQPKV